MILTLAAIDSIVSAYLAPKDRYEADWRLPRTQSMAALSGYAAHIENEHPRAGSPRVLFLGASPTWGELNSDRHHTYPAAFERRARADGLDARVYNLGADGALVSDDYFLAEGLAPHADLVVVQLTYHTFNPAARIDGDLRFPEVPRILGEAVSAKAASVLSIDRTKPLNLSGATDRMLSRHWLLFGRREELASRLFGRPLRDELYVRWQEATGTDPVRQELAPALSPNRSFDSLDPARQTEIVERYADFARFRIRSNDSELRMLDLLCADLASRRVRAAFFMSPLDVVALTDFQIFDRRSYDSNVARIRAVVEGYGLIFVDWNHPGSQLPRSDFADMTHTTDTGSALLAAGLYRALRPLLSRGKEPS
jgi:hypothetical protein